MLPTLGKVNVGLVVGVVPVVVTGVGWLVGNENVGTGVAVGLEVVVVGGAGVAGLEKKLGTAVLVVVVGGSDFTGEAGVVVVAGLVKKLGTADCAGAETVVEDAGTANKFFAGTLVSIAVIPVVGFGCVEAVEVGVNKLGVVALAVDAAVVGLNEIAGTGAGAGEGFFSSSMTFCS